MSVWCKSICEEDARLVRVRYLGCWDGVHKFRVSSLSRYWKEHTVEVRLSGKFNSTRVSSSEELVNRRLLKIWSSDEFFKYGGCAYNLTMVECALRPFFIAPRTSDHDYMVSHTALAVLDLLRGVGPGVLRSSYSVDMRFVGDRYEVIESVVRDVPVEFDF